MSSADLKRVSVWTHRIYQARRERDDAIRAAHAAGKTMRDIAEAAGVTPGRVHQIVHASPH